MVVTGIVTRTAYIDGTLAELIIEVEVGSKQDVRTFKAYGRNALRLVNYITSGRIYTLDYVEDDDEESEGEVVSAHQR